MSEKRNYKRYVVEGSSNLKTVSGSLYSFNTGVSNISFSGASIFSHERADMENKIVQFELSSPLLKESLIGKGVIKYIIKEERKDSPPIFRMGLEFIEIDKNILLRFVNKIQEIHSSGIKKAQRVKKTDIGCVGLY